MLTPTEAARARLARVLDEEPLPVEVAFQSVKEEDGVAMRPDTPRPGDATFEHEGRTVLLLDEQVSGLLAVATLVVNDSDGLALRGSEDSIWQGHRLNLRARQRADGTESARAASVLLSSEVSCSHVWGRRCWRI